MTFNRILFLVLLLLNVQNVLAQTVRLDSIRILGNEQTKDWIIERELLFQEGKVYDQTEILEYLTASKNRLLNLNLFLKVDLDLIEADLNVLEVKLLEKWYIWPIPFLEFSDRNFNVWQNLKFSPDRTNYGLYLFNYNLFGRNHSMKLSFINGYHDRYAMLYRIPFFSPKSKWGMEVEAFYDKQDELWLDTKNDKLQFFLSEDTSYIKSFSAEARFGYQHALFRNSSFRLGIERKLISEDVSQSVPYLYGHERTQNKLSIGYSFEEDYRDNRFFPLKGSYAKVGVSYSRYLSDKYPPSNRNNIALELTTHRFDRINNRWFSSYGFYGKVNSNDRLPYVDNRMLGYKQTVRGFEPYVVDGYAGFRMSTELKYLAVAGYDFNLDFVPYLRYKRLPYKLLFSYFVESGGALNTVNIFDNKLPNEILSSTGISIQNLFYNDRVLRFDMTVNSLSQLGFFIHFTKPI